MRPWTVIFFVLAFASGAASGFFVGRSQVPNRSVDIPTRDELLDAWAHEVGLDSEQKAAFKKIFDENHQRVTTIKQRAEAEIAPIRSEVRPKLRALLREDQKPRFDQYCEKRDRQRRESMQQ